jgi:hypothetical protein
VRNNRGVIEALLPIKAIGREALREKPVRVTTDEW